MYSDLMENTIFANVYFTEVYELFQTRVDHITHVHKNHRFCQTSSCWGKILYCH